MYEDCIEKFSCNRYPNGCSEECYRVEEVIKTPNCETQIIFGDNSTVTPPIPQHECPPEPMEDICPEHHCHEQERVIPKLVVVEGAPGKNGLNGKDLEFEWVYTDTEIRLGVRVKGTETWYYSPSLIGPQGPRGFKGEAGDTPYVGPGGTWWIGQTNTGIDAKSGYELPIASKEALGGIKLGGDLEVTEDGTLNIVFPEVINDYTIPKVGESHVVQTLFGNYTITTTADKTISITDPKGDIAENIVLTQDTFTFDNLYALLMTQIQLMNIKLDNVAKEVIDNLAIKTLNASEENKIDFNTLIEPQFYVIKNATTNTCVNGPALGSSGTIILEVGTKNGVVYQSVMTNTNNGLPYHRQLSSGTWSSWLSTIGPNVIRAGTLNTGMACNTPTADNHITNKKYVDEGLAQTIPNTVVGNIVAMTQEAYDELETKNPKTLYLIVEESEEDEESNSLNLVVNGDFENGLDGWTCSYPDNVSITKDTSGYEGSCMKLTVTSVYATSEGKALYCFVKHNIDVIATHVYYISGYYKGSASNHSYMSAQMRFEYALNQTIANTSYPNAQTTTWTKLSGYGTCSTTATGTIGVLIHAGYNNGDITTGMTISYDKIRVYDLTAIYGAGNEPTKEWCDENL